jgi:HEAT repeat protein
MSRTWAVAAMLLSTFLPAAARAEEDEPSFYMKKLSEWLTMLREDDKADRRRAALLVVERIGAKRIRQVVPAVAGALREDKEEKVREAAAASLGNLCAKARTESPEFKFDTVRDALTAALRMDKSARVREAAARSLGRLEADASGAVGALSAALKDPDPGARAAAADALRRLGPDAHEAVPDLQRVLRDPAMDRSTRMQCALALGRIGAPDALDALGAMKDVLADTKAPTDVRKAICEALGMLGKDAADGVAILAQTLTATTSEVTLRRGAAGALDAMGPDGRGAIPSLKKALSDDDKFVRCQAMHALGQFGKELGPHARDVVTGLLKGLDDSTLEVRIAAIETLGTLGAEGLGADTQAVTERLGEASRDSQKVVRDAAVAALQKIQGKSN